MTVIKQHKTKNTVKQLNMAIAQAVKHVGWINSAHKLSYHGLKRARLISRRLTLIFFIRIVPGSDLK